MSRFWAGIGVVVAVACAGRGPAEPLAANPSGAVRQRGLVGAADVLLESTGPPADEYTLPTLRARVFDLGDDFEYEIVMNGDVEVEVAGSVVGLAGDEIVPTTPGSAIDTLSTGDGDDGGGGGGGGPEEDRPPRVGYVIARRDTVYVMDPSGALILTLPDAVNTSFGASPADSLPYVPALSLPAGLN